MTQKRDGEAYRIKPDDVASDDEAIDILDWARTHPTKLTKRGRGKPRRAQEVAQVRSLRIDDTAANLVIRYFGTLGAAIYHTYRGLKEIQDRADAAAITRQEAISSIPLPEFVDPYALTDPEVELLRELIHLKIDKHRGHDRELTPYFQTLRKLERLFLKQKPGSPF